MASVLQKSENTFHVGITTFLIWLLPLWTLPSACGIRDKVLAGSLQKIKTLQGEV